MNPNQLDLTPEEKAHLDALGHLDLTGREAVELLRQSITTQGILYKIIAQQLTDYHQRHQQLKSDQPGNLSFVSGLDPDGNENLATLKAYTDAMADQTNGVILPLQFLERTLELAQKAVIADTQSATSGQAVKLEDITLPPLFSGQLPKVEASTPTAHLDYLAGQWQLCPHFMRRGYTADFITQLTHPDYDLTPFWTKELHRNQPMPFTLREVINDEKEKYYIMNFSKKFDDSSTKTYVSVDEEVENLFQHVYPDITRETFIKHLILLVTDVHRYRGYSVWRDGLGYDTKAQGPKSEFLQPQKTNINIFTNKNIHIKVDTENPNQLAYHYLKKYEEKINTQNTSYRHFLASLSQFIHSNFIPHALPPRR